MPAQLPEVPFGEALKFWLRLGCISFGGPAGQIAIMHPSWWRRSAGFPSSAFCTH